MRDDLRTVYVMLVVVFVLIVVNVGLIYIKQQKSLELTKPQQIAPLTVTPTNSTNIPHVNTPSNANLNEGWLLYKNIDAESSFSFIYPPMFTPSYIYENQKKIIILNMKSNGTIKKAISFQVRNETSSEIAKQIQNAGSQERRIIYINYDKYNNNSIIITLYAPISKTNEQLFSIAEKIVHSAKIIKL